MELAGIDVTILDFKSVTEMLIETVKFRLIGKMETSIEGNNCVLGS